MGQTSGYAVSRADSHAYTDGAVTLEVTNQAGTFTGPNARARRGSLTQKDITGDPAVTPSDTVWIVWSNTTGDAEIENGGTITVNGAAFTIIQAIEAGDEAQVRCICRKKV